MMRVERVFLASEELSSKLANAFYEGGGEVKK
jgi:hypothetical protein